VLDEVAAQAARHVLAARRVATLESVGYRMHDRQAIHLFCVETVAAQTVTPQAVCLLQA
jgi:hypothetical protein